MEFMELIQTVKDVIVGNYITAGLTLAVFVLPNKIVYGAGKTVGVAASKVLRQKAGKKQGEKVEKWFQGSLSALVSGLNDGMDADDNT